MNELVSAAPHVRLHRGRIHVVKVGGSSLQRRRDLAAFCEQLATVHALGARPVVVHGGGPQADALTRLLGEEVRKVDGRRVTTPTGMRALRMSLAGELNGELAAALTAAGAPAVGVCAASAGMVRARRRKPMRTTEGAVDFGEAGDVDEVNVAPLRALLESGTVPVVCPPAGDGAGGFLNVNADLLAAGLAVALEADKLVLLTGAAGVLADPADPHSVVSVLHLAEVEEMRRNGALEGGMLVKAAAIGQALRGGVPRAHVVSGSDPQALLVELYTNHGAGTMITREPHAAEVAEPDGDGAEAPGEAGKQTAPAAQQEAGS